MARTGRGRFGWLLLLLAAACANANVGPTVHSTPPPPEPPAPGSTFPFPDFGERFDGHSLSIGYGGYGLEFVARAETGPDGQADRTLSGVIDGKLIVRDARTGALAAIPVDGGAPAVIAPAVPEGAAIAGDARGIYWAAPDGSIGQAPDRSIASVPGGPRFLYVDTTDLYVFASTQAFPYDVGLALWAIPRGGGAARAVAELPGRDGVPDQRPVENADAFFFTHALSVLRLSKRGELSRITDVSAKQVEVTKAGLPYAFEAVLVDGGFVYLHGYPYLLRAPVGGGAATIVTTLIRQTNFGMWACGDRFYLDNDGSLHEAPRAGGAWRLLGSVAGPVRDVFERRGKLYVLGDRTLVRFEPIVRPDRRLVNVELENLMALGARGPNLYYTLSDATPEIWSVPKTGGEPRLVMRTPQLAAAPVFDGDFIYLLDEDGAVLRAPLGGGPTTELGRKPRGARAEPSYERRDDLVPEALGVDAGFVYALDRDQGTMLRLPKTGGAPQVVAQGMRRPIRLAMGDGFAAVETADDNKWTLVRIPLAPVPAPPQPLATGDDPIPFAVVGPELRWTIGNQVFGQTAGGAPFPLRLSSYSHGARFTDLAFRGDTLVLATEHGGLHSEVPGRDAVRVLAAGQWAPSMLIVDDDAVYFADLGYHLQHKSEWARAECCSIWTAPR